MSAIEGTVTIGPSCPVFRTDTPCPDKPYEAVIVVRNVAGAEVARGRSDAAGRFRVLVPAGRYTVTAASPTAVVIPAPVTRSVEVAEGRTTVVEIKMDSGIR